MIVLNGDGIGPVNNLAVVSNVAPSYAPEGRAWNQPQANNSWALRNRRATSTPLRQRTEHEEQSAQFTLWISAGNFWKCSRPSANSP